MRFKHQLVEDGEAKRCAGPLLGAIRLYMGLVLILIVRFDANKDTATVVSPGREDKLGEVHSVADG
jgi:hypothetical protein